MPAKVRAAGELLPGDRFAGYTVQRCLGVGGMGAVYEVVTEDDGREAIKILPSSADWQARLRFLREAEVMQALSHPHILSCLGLDEEDGVTYMRLPLLRGEDLGDCLARQYCLPVAEAARVMLATGRALAHAHGRGLVHLDLSPSNIWLRDDGVGKSHPLLLDFGVARFLSAPEGTNPDESMLIATPGYVAPERFADPSAAQEAADQYAWATVFYRCLTGELPFEVDDLRERRVLLQSKEVPPAHELRSEIPRTLSDLLSRAMHFHAAKRYESLEHAVDELAALMGKEPSVDAG